MTIKKEITENEVKEIKLTEEEDGFIDINVFVPDDMEEFFKKYQKTLLSRIFPLLLTMKTERQPLFEVKFSFGDKYYAFRIEECAAPDTALN